eukprot:m.63895 g.63895  ORF g.63895 m.63895 type:complete len:84 (+) comp8092_c0_seq1:127-378(+)
MIVLHSYFSHIALGLFLPTQIITARTSITPASSVHLSLSRSLCFSPIVLIDLSRRIGIGSKLAENTTTFYISFAFIQLSNQFH